MCAYGLILYNASNMLSNGSELLLLVPSISGIVGSVVLPVLGAVPDGAIMLFSGLGDAAQENITVGVGTLAGSTIMLLTIPWSLSILLGAVPVDGGVAVYSRRQEKVNPCALSSFGVSPDATIRSNAYVMVATALLYLVIQGPAFQYATKPEYLEPPKSAVASHTEHGFALAGLMLTTAAFVGYLVLMVRQSQQSSPVREYRVTAVALKALDDNPHISLSGIIAPIIADAAQFQANVPAGQYVSASVMTIESVAKKKLAALLKPQFHKYDVDHDGKISVVELHMLLSDVGERLTINETRQWMERLDPDRSGEIEQHEFLEMMLNYIKEKIDAKNAELRAKPKPFSPAMEAAFEQQVMIKRRAAMLCGLGTALILLFSDPMVEVFSNVGKRLAVPPFYIAFVMAPLASNASELIASLLYASKKSRKTITVSLSALEGAACMNNTFCLAIFMGLIYFKGLVWKFTAETCAILLVQLLVAGVALQHTQRLYHAILVLLLYPLSILFVAMVEARGLD